LEGGFKGVNRSVIGQISDMPADLRVYLTPYSVVIGATLTASSRWPKLRYSGKPSERG
jgi:hypothetical protein